MVILREKVLGRSSRRLYIREVSYDIVRNRIFLPLNKIKTFKIYMKRRRIVYITNTPGEYFGYRLNPDSSSGIYTTVVK